jgi:hypothetical protein
MYFKVDYKKMKDETQAKKKGKQKENFNQTIA